MSRIARIVPTRIYRLSEGMSVANESNMFTDTDSETYAVLTTTSASNDLRVGGFDFSQLPSSLIVVSYSLKMKLKGGENMTATSPSGTKTVLYNGSQQFANQERISFKIPKQEPYISSVNNPIAWSELVAAADDLNVSMPFVPTQWGNQTYIYGIEIQVEYDLPVNKVVYGTTVLVDLTEDTVTPDDLSEGVTAHDKSGGLITGTNQRGIMVIRDSDDSHGGTVRTITSGEAQIGGMTEADLKKYVQRDNSFTSIDWPEGITVIGAYAFASCIYFDTVRLPSTVVTIKSNAFNTCTHLSLTELPSGVTSIESYAFAYCTKLALTELPNGIKRIEQHVFHGCTELALTELPSGVTYIGSNAFHNCSNLALTSLPSGVTSIEEYTFYQCSSLSSLELPSGVTSIGQYAFAYCTGLEQIILPDSLTTISTGVFSKCENLIDVSCEGAITLLQQSIFTGDTNHPMKLRSASFPNMDVSTLSYVFGSSQESSACQNLEFCDLGTVKMLSNYTFAYCHSLETLILRRSTAITSLGTTNAFLDTPMRGYNNLTGTVYVPQALIESYKTASNWSALYSAGTVTFLPIEGSQYERE